MIDLRLKIDPLPIVEPLVLRLREYKSEHENDAVLVAREGERREFDFNGFSFAVFAAPTEELDGDVLLLLPGRGIAHRLIRANSKHNTLLVTEQCDQLCVMCSQPPKKHHNDFFAQFELAIELAPANAVLGVSGGEPLLHKRQLFELLRHAVSLRPDVKFHILTNGQHFDCDDVPLLEELGRDRVLWGCRCGTATALHFKD